MSVSKKYCTITIKGFKKGKDIQMLPKPDRTKGENLFTGIIFHFAAVLIIAFMFLMINYSSYLKTTAFIENGVIILLVANVLDYWWKESLYLEDTALKATYASILSDDNFQGMLTYFFAFISSGFLRLCFNAFALVNTIDALILIMQETILLINYNRLQKAK